MNQDAKVWAVGGFASVLLWPHRLASIASSLFFFQSFFGFDDQYFDPDPVDLKSNFLTGIIAHIFQEHRIGVPGSPLFKAMFHSNQADRAKRLFSTGSFGSGFDPFTVLDEGKFSY